MMSRYDPPTFFDIRAALFFSHIDAMLVSGVSAAWMDRGKDKGRVGVLLQTVDRTAPWTYVVHEWDEDSHSVRIKKTTTSTYKKKPVHLFDRAEKWFLEGDVIAEINKELGYTKAYSKFGSVADPSDYPYSFTLARPHG
jgi:hypothetical protein